MLGNMFERFFGRPKNVPAPEPAVLEQPTLEEASQKIDQQLLSLERKIDNCDAEVRHHMSVGTNNPTAKQRAIQAMKRKKMYEQQRDKLLGTQFNVDNLAFQQEQAVITATAVRAMQAGTEQLKRQQAEIDVATVEKLTDDIADLTTDLEAMNEALASGFGGRVSDEEVEKEYERMQEEAVASALCSGSRGSAATPATTTGLASAASTSLPPLASEPGEAVTPLPI